MIARAESGQARGNMDDFDAADVASGIHELYEPLAEDDGMTLRLKTATAPLHGNRELISQALANLVENAIKYGKPAAAQPQGSVVSLDSKQILIEARREGDHVEVGEVVPDAETTGDARQRYEANPQKISPFQGMILVVVLILMVVVILCVPPLLDVPTVPSGVCLSRC